MVFAVSCNLGAGMFYLGEMRTENNFTKGKGGENGQPFGKPEPGKPKRVSFKVLQRGSENRGHAGFYREQRNLHCSLRLFEVWGTV